MARPFRFFCLLLGCLLTSAYSTAAEPPAAAADSTLIASFLALPEDSLAVHIEAGEQLVARARNNPSGPERRQLLAQAAAHNPALTHTWVALADLERVMGYLEDAAASLAAARVTIDFLEGEDRRSAIRDYSLARAWYHYEMGEWEDGRRWGQRAVKFKAGMEGHLVTALNSAEPIHTMAKMKEACMPFRPIDSGGNRRANMSWCYALHFYLHNYDFDERDASTWLPKTTHHHQHDVARWRDYGTYCEANRSGRLAIGYFEKSYQALMFKGSWVTRLDHPIPPASSPMVMPFWINSDQGYVTGSLLAYLGYLHDTMIAASLDDRPGWATLILAHAQRTSHRYPRYPWTFLWLSEAQLTLGLPDEAEQSVENARATFKAMDLNDPQLDRVHGHILLVQKHARRADPMIRRAIVHFPEDGTCWTDLGLVEVMAGNREAALKAFDRALELDPGLVAAWYNRGLTKMHAGRYDEALADLEEAARLQPGNTEITTLVTQIGQKLALDAKN